MTTETAASTYRIIDVNLNRLREALRVVEEYFRFVMTNETWAVTLKQLRHSLEEFSDGIPRKELLSARDTLTDPFAGKNRREEMQRTDMHSMLAANFKRAQEAARVLEEYLKMTPAAHLSGHAKTIRFSLYAFEKQVME